MGIRDVCCGKTETSSDTAKFWERGWAAGIGECSATDVYVSKRITSIFLMLGIPTKIKGYRYLREAVTIAVHDVNSTNRMRAHVYGAGGQVRRGQRGKR